MSTSSAAINELVTVRRRQDRSIQTRAKILAAATLEFCRTGFNGATARSIADRADVPHALVIYHFKTKLGIWRAVMEEAITDFHHSLEREYERNRGCDPVAALKGLQRLFIRLSATRPELNWLMSHEMGTDSTRLNLLFEKIAGDDVDRSIELIRECQQLGRFVAGDPAHLHFLFVGAASRVFLMPIEIENRTGRSPFDEAFIKAHITLCESMFFREPDDAPENSGG